MKIALDARKSNQNLLKRQYLLPSIDWLTDTISQHISAAPNPDEIIFSKLDISFAFGQLKLAEETSKLCCFRIMSGTLTGIYRYIRGFYGLSETPLQFQKAIDQILARTKETFWYLDDIIIISYNKQDHLNQMSDVFSRLEKSGITISAVKCEFKNQTWNA